MIRKHYLSYRKLEVEYKDRKGRDKKQDMIIVPEFLFYWLVLYIPVYFVWNIVRAIWFH